MSSVVNATYSSYFWVARRRKRSRGIMTRDETEALLRYRWSALGTRFGDQVVDAWADLLADTPQTDARRALVEMIRHGHTSVSVAQILELAASYRRATTTTAGVEYDGPVVDPSVGRKIARDAAIREMQRRGKTPEQIAARLSQFAGWVEP
jgi:hypothetical protein